MLMAHGARLCVHVVDFRPFSIKFGNPDHWLLALNGKHPPTSGSICRYVQPWFLTANSLFPVSGPPRASRIDRIARDETDEPSAK